MRIQYQRVLLFAVLLIVSLSGYANEVEIRKVELRKSGNNWTFNVTIKHADTGWNHYADAWRVVDENGKQIKIRILAHPHVDEQPFTRSLTGVTIPHGAKTVTIEARDKVHGWSKDKVVIDLNKNTGDRYRITR